MGAPIYTPDPFQGLNDTLVKLLLAKQNQESQKEDLKLRKQALEQHAQEQQYQQQQAQQQQQQQQASQQFDVSRLLAPLLAQAGQGVNAAFGAPVQQVDPGLPAQQQFAQFSQQPGMDRNTVLAAASGAMRQMEEQRKKQEEVAALEEGFKLAAPLLSPEELMSFRASIQFARGGASKEQYEAILPSKLLELAKLRDEGKDRKSMAELDALATPWLVKYGTKAGAVFSPGGPVKGAWDIMQGEIKEIQKDARASNQAFGLKMLDLKAKAEESRIAGAAADFVANGITDPIAIREGLKAYMPEKDANELMPVAVAATKDAKASDFEQKTKLIYGIGKRGADTIDRLQAQGVKLSVHGQTMVADWAQKSQLLNQVPGWSEKATVELRQKMKKTLSAAEQILVNSVMDVVDTRLKTTTGATASPGEVMGALQTMAPMEGDAPESLTDKTGRRQTFMRGVAEAAGMRTTMLGKLIDDHGGPAAALKAVEESNVNNPSTTAIKVQLRRMIATGAKEKEVEPTISLPAPRPPVATGQRPRGY